LFAKQKKDVILEYIDELQRAKYNISLENLRFINNRKVHFFME